MRWPLLGVSLSKQVSKEMVLKLSESLTEDKGWLSLNNFFFEISGLNSTNLFRNLSSVEVMTSGIKVVSFLACLNSLEYTLTIQLVTSSTAMTRQLLFSFDRYVSAAGSQLYEDQAAIDSAKRRVLETTD